jgi:hypothetical protein
MLGVGGASRDGGVAKHAMRRAAAWSASVCDVYYYSRCWCGLSCRRVLGPPWYRIWVKVPPESRAGAIANAFPESSAKDSYRSGLVT